MFNYPIGSGGKPSAKPMAKPMGGTMEAEPEGGDQTEQIHQHLTAMHAATRHGHSHIEHKGDGSHVAHHVSHEGEVSGPEPHEDCPGGMCEGGKDEEEDWK